MTTRLFLIAVMLFLSGEGAQAADMRSEAVKTILEYGRRYVRELIDRLPIDLPVAIGVDILKQKIWPEKQYSPQREPDVPGNIYARTFVDVYNRMLRDKTYLSQLPPRLAAYIQQWDICADPNANIDLDLRIAGCTAVIRAGDDTVENISLAFNNRGAAYANKGQPDPAILDLDGAIRLNPNNALALRNRAFVYAVIKAYGSAILDLDQAINLNPNNADAFGDRGAVYAATGQPDRAILDLNQAIILDPNDYSAFYSRASVYFTIQQYDRANQDYEQAIRRSEQAVRLNPNDAWAWYIRGKSKRAKGDFIEGDADIARAKQIDPSVGN
jgi:tetratricopeptide (TPR) repeat protein